MGTMAYETMSEIARNGSEEDFANLLKVAGEYVVKGTEDRWLDVIYKEMAQDKDKGRKARKLSIITAYDAEGDKALEKIQVRPELQTLRQLAFESASEKVVDLLKTQANDQEAVQAIIEGVQLDRKHRLKRETAEDKSRRSDKKDIVAEFYAKSGRFAPAEETAPDAQAQIAELKDQLAEVQKALAKQQSEKPTPLRLQQS